MQNGNMTIDGLLSPPLPANTVPKNIRNETTDGVITASTAVRSGLSNSDASEGDSLKILRRDITHDLPIPKSGLNLVNLTGVKSDDKGSEAALFSSSHGTSRSARWSFSTSAIGYALFLLLAALAASVTLLLIQAHNHAQTQAFAVSSSQQKNDVAAGDDSTSIVGESSSANSHSSTTSSEPSSNASSQGSAPMPDNRIDINSATAEQLDSVKGIGPVTAKKIVDYRSQHGRFTSVDDLMGVQGIGAKTLEKMRSSLVAR